MKAARSISFPTYVVLWAIAVALPFCLIPISVPVSAIVGIIITGLWIAFMPHSCINGAFIYFPMTLIQIALGLMWGIRLYKQIK